MGHVAQQPGADRIGERDRGAGRRPKRVGSASAAACALRMTKGAAKVAAKPAQSMQRVNRDRAAVTVVTMLAVVTGQFPLSVMETS